MASKKGTTKQENSDSEIEIPPPAKKSKGRNPPSPQTSKWDEVEIKKLIELRKSGMSFGDLIKDHFPGRTQKALERCYQRYEQRLEEEFSAEKDEALKNAVENYQKRMWINIGKEIGMSPAGCKKRASEKRLARK